MSVITGVLLAVATMCTLVAVACLFVGDWLSAGIFALAGVAFAHTLRAHLGVVRALHDHQCRLDRDP